MVTSPVHIHLLLLLEDRISLVHICCAHDRLLPMIGCCFSHCFSHSHPPAPLCTTAVCFPRRTVNFMAPEVIDGSLCKASDVYSFGVLLWQLVAGTQPFRGYNHPQVMLGVLQVRWGLRAGCGTTGPALHCPHGELLGTRCMMHCSCSSLALFLRTARERCIGCALQCAGRAGAWITACRVLRGLRLEASRKDVWPTTGPV